ncbi:UvrB/UvrC motif-containing protein [Bacillus sp. NPDC094106]|uniref:UvrB/UvrC motif-containing protein n=1 Tax=Bacillus sp. NPDC094106 TaxID=3363949 RepID=UPI003810B01D
MTCQNCNIRPAALHYTKVVNGKKTEVHLCEQCAEQSGYTSFFQSPQSSFSFHDLLAGLLHGEPSMFEQQENHFTDSKVLKCPDCKMTYEQFAKVGRFGCSSCYEAFGEQIKPMLKRLHGGHTHHCGKIPEHMGGNIHLKKELDELKLSLKQYVQKEEFEKAAQVRDQIRSIENQLSEHRKGE